MSFSLPFANLKKDTLKPIPLGRFRNRNPQLNCAFPFRRRWKQGTCATHAGMVNTTGALQGFWGICQGSISGVILARFKRREGPELLPPLLHRRLGEHLVPLLFLCWTKMGMSVSKKEKCKQIHGCFLLASLSTNPSSDTLNQNPRRNDDGNYGNPRLWLNTGLMARCPQPYFKPQTQA